MTNPPIYQEAEQALIDHGRQDIDGIKRIFRNLTHHNPAQEGTTTMNLAQVEADIHNDVQTGMDKAADLYNHLKSVAEGLAPKLAVLQASPVVQALEGLVLPPEVETELASLVKTYAARFGTPEAAPTPAPAPVEPAEPAA